MLRNTLKRQARADYLRRVENSARTVEDFTELVDMYDKLDANRERRERYYEISVSEYKLLNTEIGKSNKGIDPEQRETERRNGYSDGKIIPAPIYHPYWRELMRGDFINYIFDNALEMWQIIGDWQVGRLLRYELTDKQKETLFLSAVRLATTEQIGCYTGKTDRAVRRLLTAAFENIRKPLARMTRKRLEDELPVTLGKQRFLEWFERQQQQI
jgi:hypothetical protein